MKTPENQPAQTAGYDALFGIDADKHRAAQLEINCTWLLAKINRIHAALCPGQLGTWQQRAEQAVTAAEALSPNLLRYRHNPSTHDLP
jgi:hypothetical protein